MSNLYAQIQKILAVTAGALLVWAPFVSTVSAVTPQEFIYENDPVVQTQSAFKDTTPRGVGSVVTAQASLAPVLQSHGEYAFQLITENGQQMVSVSVPHNAAEGGAVSLAVYKMYDRTLETQVYYSGVDNVQLNVDGSKTIKAPLPPCMAQIDLYSIPVAPRKLAGNGTGYPLLGFAYYLNDGPSWNAASGSFCTNASIAIQKSGPATVQRGDILSYQISVTNTGPVRVAPVVVTDTVPVGTSFVSADSACQLAGVTSAAPRGTVQCRTEAGLAPGAKITYTISVRVDSQIACGSIIENKATASAAPAQPVESTLVKTAVQCPVAQLVCTPQNQTTALNQSVQVSATGGTGTYNWSAPGSALATTGTGAAFTVRYGAVGTYHATVTSGSVSASCQVSVTDPNTTVSIQKLVRNVTQNTVFAESLSAVNTSDVLEYQIRIRNNGTQTAQAVSVRDIVDQASLLTQMRGFSISRASSGSLGGTNLLTLNEGLPAGQEVIIVYSYTFMGMPGGAGACNTATVTSSNAGTSSDIACVRPAVGSPSLVLSKSAWNDTQNKNATTIPALREDFITYTLTVRNNGTQDAVGFVITDDLSSVLPLADMVDTGGGVVTGQAISYPATTVPANGSISKTFRVRVKYFLSSRISYVMTNTYGNTLEIRINPPQTYTPPRTGGMVDMLAALGFASVLTLGLVLWRKKNLAKLIFS